MDRAVQKSRKCISVRSAELARFRNTERFMPLCESCQNHGKNYACPPMQTDVDTFFDEYPFVLVLLHEFTVTGDSDILAARRMCDEHALDGERMFMHARAFFSGACVLCDSCTRPTGKECRKSVVCRLAADCLSLDMTAVCRQFLQHTLKWSSKNISLVNLIFYS